MWIDVSFPGGIVSRTYYRIIHDIALPDGINLNGVGNGIIMFTTNRTHDRETLTYIVEQIADRHEESRNYLIVAVKRDLRREEYVPDVLVQINRGHRHIEGQGCEVVLTVTNDANFLRRLFVSNKFMITEAVSGLIGDVGERVDTFDFDFRQEDGN